MATVILPDSLVRLFPGAARRTDVAGETVFELIVGLEACHPGMRDRILDGRPAIRRHVVIFVNSDRAALDTPVSPADEVQVIPAMSGG